MRGDAAIGVRREQAPGAFCTCCPVKGKQGNNHQGRGLYMKMPPHHQPAQRQDPPSQEQLQHGWSEQAGVTLGCDRYSTARG